MGAVAGSGAVGLVGGVGVGVAGGAGSGVVGAAGAGCGSAGSVGLLLEAASVNRCVLVGVPAA